MVGDLLGGGDPPAAAGDDQPQLAVERSGLLEQRRDLGTQRGPVELEPQAGGRAFQPGDVVVIDAATGARRMLTRTSESESAPRWARS